MGNTCNSMADSCQCMTRPIQYCKVISLQLIKINEKKKERGRARVQTQAVDMESIQLVHYLTCHCHYATKFQRNW